MPSSMPSSPSSFAASQLARIGRQLMLVPEAVLLLALLCLHASLGGSPLLAGAGLLLAAYFVIRASLLTMSRRAAAEAEYDRAERLARGAYLLHPLSADVHGLLGGIALARGRAEQAVESLRLANRLFPGQSELQIALSAALIANGDLREARDAAQLAIGSAPGSAAAYLHLAEAEELNGAAPAIVEGLLRTGLALRPRPAVEAALRCSLAALLVGQGRLEETRQALTGARQLIERCPAQQQAGIHFYLGELYRALGDEELARGHFLASESLDPQGRYAAAAWRAARS